MEGGLDLAEHDVQRPAEAPDLGPRIPLRHPPAQIAGGDGASRLLDIRQRPQAAPHDSDADYASSEEQQTLTMKSMPASWPIVV